MQIGTQIEIIEINEIWEITNITIIGINSLKPSVEIELKNNDTQTITRMTLNSIKETIDDGSAQIIK